jgi:hypothetical protein
MTTTTATAANTTTTTTTTTPTIKILLAVRTALSKTPDLIAMERRADLITRYIYGFSLIWGMVGAGSGWAGFSEIGNNGGAFCWFGDALSKLLFFYLLMFVSLVGCLGTLLHLLYLQNRHNIPLNDITRLLVTLSLAFIAVWTVPMCHR